MPIQHQAVQACHASVAAGRDLIRLDSPYLILVTVPTQHDLIELSTRLTKEGIAHRVFCEEDMGGRPTALATIPVSQKQRKLFQKFPLYNPLPSTEEMVA